MSWSRTSWKDYKILQQPIYQDESAVQAAKERLYKLPPLIFAGEVRNLKAELARASASRFCFKAAIARRALMTLARIISAICLK